MSAQRGRRLREAIVRRCPTAVMEYPFESFIALFGAFIGLTLGFGAIRPDSLFAILPAAVAVVYALAAVAGALTIMVGLMPQRKNPVPMAVGLRLIAFILFVYGAAVIGFTSFASGGMAGTFFILIAGLAFFRSMFLRAQAEAVFRAHRGE